MLTIRQIHSAIIANILHNIGAAIFEHIATARLLIHSHHLALILDAANNPAIGVKIGRIDGGDELVLRCKLRNATTSVIGACCAKGQQLIASTWLHAD